MEEGHRPPGLPVAGSVRSWDDFIFLFSMKIERLRPNLRTGFQNHVWGSINPMKIDIPNNPSRNFLRRERKLHKTSLRWSF